VWGVVFAGFEQAAFCPFGYHFGCCVFGEVEGGDDGVEFIAAFLFNEVLVAFQAPIGKIVAFEDFGAGGLCIGHGEEAGAAHVYLRFYDGAHERALAQVGVEVVPEGERELCGHIFSFVQTPRRLSRHVPRAAVAASSWCSGRNFLKSLSLLQGNVYLKTHGLAKTVRRRYSKIYCGA
jgi:hypothetical protein